MLEKLIGLITAYTDRTGSYPNTLQLTPDDYANLCKLFHTDQVQSWRGMKVKQGTKTEVYRELNEQRKV